MTIGRPMSMLLGVVFEAVFSLNCPVGPVTLRENYGFPGRELRHIPNVLAANLEDLCRAWEHIHGIA